MKYYVVFLAMLSIGEIFAMDKFNLENSACVAQAGIALIELSQAPRTVPSCTSRADKRNTILPLNGSKKRITRRKKVKDETYNPYKKPCS